MQDMREEPDCRGVRRLVFRYVGVDQKVRDTWDLGRVPSFQQWTWIGKPQKQTTNLNKHTVCIYIYTTLYIHMIPQQLNLEARFF